MKTLNKKGVTLIELLVVLVLISIVSAIGFVTFSNLISNTEKDVLLIDAQAIDQQFESCVSSNDESTCLGFIQAALGTDTIDFDGTEKTLSKDVTVTDLTGTTVTLSFSDKYTLSFDIVNDDVDSLTRTNVVEK